MTLVVFSLAIGDNTSIKLMGKRGLWRYVKLMLLLAVLIVSGDTNSVFAVTSSSNNYQVTETELGGSTSSQNCSASYCAKASIGDMTSSATSKSYATKATFGPITGSDPLLEVIVDPGVSNLGVLSADSTSTKTTTVRVRNYLSSGYMIQIVGTPPKYKDHTLSTPSTPTVSTPGTEQFAINAAANTTPHVGAGVIQVPDNLTSFGKVEDNYATANMFMYHSGDVVGSSVTESGESQYTISMIVNVSNKTPAGHFSGDFSAVVIPVF
ncbi:MAG: exported protein of unknown function [Candidatus Saccharibacteria bacterium]|nr:exported protein of unknown function [Candidatus Saccharibacteria bacterium]